MPTPTYTPLANLTLGSTASTVTFSSISQSYRDLVLVILANGTTGANLALRANSDSSSSYTLVRMFGNSGGASSGSGSETYFYCSGVNGTANTQFKIDLLDYTATDKHKTALVVADQGGDTVMRIATRWPSTSAITTLNLSLTAGSFTAGSSFALFGIAS